MTGDEDNAYRGTTQFRAEPTTRLYNKRQYYFIYPSAQPVLTHLWTSPAPPLSVKCGIQKHL